MRIATESQTSLAAHPSRTFLPAKVTDVPKDLLRSYPHTKRVGNYLLGRTLGEGSFAKVKEGLHALTGEKVAVKVIDKKKAREDAYVRKNLRREGKLLQMVRHPHVVQLYEILETENSYYLVTELCKGGDLMDYICNQKRLEEKEARKFIRHVLSAVNYMHKVGILHRDLKVENLLLDENKNIKIIDFGLSNAVRVSHTNKGSSFQEFCVTQCGSPAYAAPELLGNKKYGPKVDVWSIGVNLYAMLTGNLPFTVEPFNIKALYQKMLDGNMNPIPDHISSGCRNLLKSFLIPDPDRRISLQEAMEHPWITSQDHDPIDPIPFPNRLVADELDSNVVRHMSECMDFRMSEVIRLVTSNIPNNATATYHLMNRKLRRYLAQERPLQRRETIQESKIIVTPKQSVHKTPSDTKVTPGQVIELLPLSDNRKASSDPKGNEQITPRSPARAPSVASPRLNRRRQQRASLHQNEADQAVAKQPVSVPVSDRDDVQVIRIVPGEGSQRTNGLTEAAPPMAPSRVRLLSPRPNHATNGQLDSPSAATELPDIHQRAHSPSSEVSEGRAQIITTHRLSHDESKLSPRPGVDRLQRIPSLTSRSTSTHSVASSTSRRSTLSNTNDQHRSERKGQSVKHRHSVTQPGNDVQVIEGHRKASQTLNAQANDPNSNTMITQPERPKRFANLAQVDTKQQRTSPSRLSPTVPRRRESFEAVAPVDATALAVITDRSTESRLGTRPVLRRGSIDMHSPIMKRKSVEKLLNMNNLPGGHIHEPSMASINSKDMRKPLPAISPPLTGKRIDH